MFGSLERSRHAREVLNLSPAGTGIQTLDIALLAIVMALVAVNIPLAAVACSQFSFYPTPPQLLAWWGYAPYAALMLVAPALYLGEVIRWRS